jgi:hypothetical protein
MLSRPSVSVVVADILYALAGDGVPAAPGGVEAHVQSQAADAMTIHIYLEHSMGVCSIFALPVLPIMAMSLEPLNPIRRHCVLFPFHFSLSRAL